MMSVPSLIEDPERIVLTGKSNVQRAASSMHHDLERGNPLEVEWLSGGVVRLGQQVGVPTPCAIS